MNLRKVRIEFNQGLERGFGQKVNFCPNLLMQRPHHGSCQHDIANGTETDDQDLQYSVI
jgi:hypothetical protein